MYLRWCDKKGDVFQLFRNGDVRVIARGLWGPMGSQVAVAPTESKGSSSKPGPKPGDKPKGDDKHKEKGKEKDRHEDKHKDKRKE